MANQHTTAKWTDADYIAYWRSHCVVDEKGCWLWQRFCVHFRNQKPGVRGYAGSSYRGEKIRLNRKMLELKLGRPLLPGMHGCHHCDTPSCINPDHLYEATNQQNHLDGGKRKRMQGQTKTHCKHGHEFTPENTYWSKRGLSKCRNCKECQRIYQRRRWQEQNEYCNARQRSWRAKRKLLQLNPLGD